MDLKTAPPSYNNPDSRAVAIVGMAIQAPGGTSGTVDTTGLFELLKARGSGIVTVPADRWNAEAYVGEAPGKLVTDKGAFLSDVGIGDLQEFGISTREASQISPHQMHALHVAFEALQRSGIDFRGTNTGVFMGCTNSDFGLDRDETEIQEYYCTGSAASIVANRISYVFDLTGPSLPVDTACSSTLTAMHLAVQAIRNGDCDQAVVGGVSFVLSLLDAVSFSRLGVLSPDGISKSFDADANGYARGEVAGAVVIKRHNLAVRDGDHIHGTLVGTALATCGSAMGSITTPNPVTQTEAIRRAYANAGLQPCDVDFLELHGTGTQVGDRIEANAAGAICTPGRNGLPLPIGSIKSNIGHGEMGAYISSLIKVIMMLENKVILPNGYFEKPSPEIDFAKYNLYVPVAVENFVPQDKENGLIASISSYGFGGSCGHTVLREHDPRPERSGEVGNSDVHIFAVGAMSPKACNSLVQTYTSDYQHVSRPLLSEQVGTRARQMPWRAFAIASDISEASFSEPVLVPKAAPPVVFCFSGQGPQHIAMGKGLFDQYSVFKDSILASDAAYVKYVGKSFLEETGLFVANEVPASPTVSDKQIWTAPIISVSLTMFQIALHDLLVSLGVRPSMIIGHSIGETAAFYASGAMAREMVIQIAVARGRALSLIDGQGAMLAVSGLTYDELVEYQFTDKRDTPTFHIASLNGPRDFGVSGGIEDIDRLVTTLGNHVPGAKSVKLRVSTAVHSPFVDPCEASYRYDLKKIFATFPTPHLPIIPVVSSVTARPVLQPYDIDYLWSNLRHPVRFSSAFSAVKETAGNEPVVVELSPHPVLAQYLYTLGAVNVIIPSRRLPRNLGSLPPCHAQIRTFLEALGALLISGVNSVDFRRLNGWPKGNFSAPMYPFLKKAHKVFPQVPSYFKRLLPPSKPLNSERLKVSPSLPESWMGDHVIKHSNIIPASAYIEMALEFPNVTSIWGFEFVKVFSLDNDGAVRTLQVKTTGDQVEITSPTRPVPSHAYGPSYHSAEPTYGEMHARGRLGYGMPRLDKRCLTRVDVSEVASRCPFYFTGKDVDAEFSTWAQFGPSFRRILRGCANDQEVLCWIRGPVDLSPTKYIFHPALMDAAFQSFVGWPLQWAHVNTSEKNSTFGLPHSLERGFRNDGSVGPLSLPQEFPVYSRMSHWTPHTRTMDCFVLDLDGKVLFTFLGLQFREPGRPLPPALRYTEHWQDRSFPSDEPRFPPPLPLSDAFLSNLLAASHALDDLALKYTRQTLARALQLPEDLPYDRQKYFQWAVHLTADATSEDIVIPEVLQDDRNALREITERVARSQPDIMVSSAAAVQALFVDDVMSQIYKLGVFDTEILTQTTGAIVQAISEAFTRGRKVVRILEVGAGTGRMTALLGEALLSQGFPTDCFVDYVCTDVSISLAQEASKKCPWPTITAKAFDVTRSAAEQSINEASFDIIVAFDVLHAIPNLRDLLIALRRLLVPGGFLAAIELDGESFASSLPGTRWMDYIFGSFREWFGALQYRDAGAVHCTLSRDEWEKCLSLAGFHPTSWARDDRPTARHIGFLAQNTVSAESCTGGTASYDTHSPCTLFYRWTPDGETQLVAYLSKLDSTIPIVLWIHGDDSEPSRALIGLGRSLQQEFPLWRIHIILFDDSWCSDGQEQFIREHLAELSWADPEILVDINGGMRVSRLIPWSDPPTSRKLTKHEVPSLKLEVLGTTLYPSFSPPLGPHDVEVSVDHVSLVSWFEPFAGFTGIVVGIGPAVDSASSRVRVGQRVFGMAENSRARTIICPMQLVEPIPSYLADHKFLASDIGIATLARILEHFIMTAVATPRILLHLGDGKGLAAAAYRILSRKGIQLTATIDSPQSTSFPHDGGLFATGSVEEWTSFVESWAPSGVDMILNFQSNVSVLDAVASILCPTGTVMQFSRSDVVAATPPLKSAQRFMKMDLHALVNAEPTFLRNAFTNTDEQFIAHSDALPMKGGDPIVQEHFSKDDDAVPEWDLFSFDASKEYDGIRMQVSNEDISFDPRRTYVVVGGIGGVGIAFACCLVERGARKIILTSRSGSKGLSSSHLVRERAVFSYLQGIPGVDIQLVAADCTDEKEMRQVFSTIQCAGIFFMPVLLADALVLNMTDQTDWGKVYDVKVKGFRTLLNVVDTRELDFLLIASSMASVLGSPGQANYTASQTWMEAVAEKVPKCVAITVPPILDGGVFVKGISRQEKRNAALEKYLSFGMLGTDFCFYCLEAISMILSDAAPSLYIPNIEWEHGLHLVPSYAQSRIRHLVLSTRNTAKDEAKDGLGLKEICASVLALEPTAIEDNIPLSSYGLDSLTSVRLSNLLKGRFGFAITQMQLLASTMTTVRLSQLYADSCMAQTTKPLDEIDKIRDQPPVAGSDPMDIRHYSADYELLKLQLKAFYPPISSSYSKRSLTILLTGATGFIGSFLLKELLSHSQVKKVVCLVRCDITSNPLIRLKEGVSSHITWDESWVQASRVQALCGDLALDCFGLVGDLWDHIAMEVDCIVHNGALVHWAHSYETLRATNVLSVLTATNLASIGRSKSVIYVSSTATLGSGISRNLSQIDPPNGSSIMETWNLEENRPPLTFGYAQSKWVSEKLLHDAAKRGLSGYIVKPPFVLGDTTSGACNSGDFFWRFVKGCIQLGYIPNLNTTLNAIPVDHLARFISHAALSPSHHTGLKTLHVDHDTRFTLPQLHTALTLQGYSIRSCEYSLWLEYIEHAISIGEANSILPVLEFARRLEHTLAIPPLDITNTTQLLSSSTGPPVTMFITHETFTSYLTWLINKGDLPSSLGSNHTNF